VGVGVACLIVGVAWGVGVAVGEAYGVNITALGLGVALGEVVGADGVLALHPLKSNASASNAIPISPFFWLRMAALYPVRA